MGERTEQPQQQRRWLKRIIYGGIGTAVLAGGILSTYLCGREEKAEEEFPNVYKGCFQITGALNKSERNIIDLSEEDGELILRALHIDECVYKNLPHFRKPSGKSVTIKDRHNVDRPLGVIDNEEKSDPKTQRTDKNPYKGKKFYLVLHNLGEQERDNILRNLNKDTYMVLGSPERREYFYLNKKTGKIDYAVKIEWNGEYILHINRGDIARFLSGEIHPYIEPQGPFEEMKRLPR